MIGPIRGVRRKRPRSLLVGDALAAAALAPGETIGAASGRLHRPRPVPALRRESLLERGPDAVVDRRAVGPDRLLREFGDDLGEFDSRRQGLVLGRQPVDQALLLCLLRAEFPAGQNQLQGPPEADDPRQALGAAVDQRNAEPPLEATEHRRLAGDAEVTP